MSSSNNNSTTIPPSPPVSKDVLPSLEAQLPVAAPAPPSRDLMGDLGNSIKATESSSILRVMRALNISMAIGTVVTGLLTWILSIASGFDEIVASIYIVGFGLLLLAFECRNESMDATIQLNFGFMYGYKTRTVFLLFMAIWPLSISHWITILDAVLLFCNAFFNLYVIYNHPAFCKAPPAYGEENIA